MRVRIPVENLRTLEDKPAAVNKVTWRTSGDGKSCNRCESRDGSSFSMQEALSVVGGSYCALEECRCEFEVQVAEGDLQRVSDGELRGELSAEDYAALQAVRQRVMAAGKGVETDVDGAVASRRAASGSSDSRGSRSKQGPTGDEGAMKKFLRRLLGKGRTPWT